MTNAKGESQDRFQIPILSSKELSLFEELMTYFVSRDQSDEVNTQCTQNTA